jgi:hypothetical protein
MTNDVSDHIKHTIPTGENECLICGVEAKGAHLVPCTDPNPAIPVPGEKSRPRADRKPRKNIDMTFEEWVKLNEHIYQQWEYIQKRTYNMAQLGIANASNPEFDALMKMAQQLTKDSDRYRQMLEEAETKHAAP